MKIIVIGGYGIFGGRLCQLLTTHANLSIVVAGRSLQHAQKFCRSLPPDTRCEPTAFDRDHDLDRQLQHVGADLVIDASGPFQSYGADPYRLVKACLTQGINYMDFADGSDFVNGISEFDDIAKAKKLFILSGVSSFPVLTAAVVRNLSEGLRQITSIKGGIAPSPYAVMGLNVMRAISAYAGKPVRLVRDGRQTFAYALTEGMHYTISPPGRLPLKNTYFSLVDVPDLQVLPNLWPELKSVWMGAGPVPELLHRMLNAMAWLVRWRIIPTLRPFAPIFLRAIDMMRHGDHRGGMFVEIEGQESDGKTSTRSWHLLAEGDDGPYIPCMALEAVVIRILQGKLPPAGARPASGDLELEDYEHLFARRTIFTGRRDASADYSSHSIFKTLLAKAWGQLPTPVQDFHHAAEALHLCGTATVERGKGWLGKAVAAVFGFPAAGSDIAVDVLFEKRGDCETWTRSFAGRSFSSLISAGAGRSDKLLHERFGPLTFELALVVDDGKLRYIVAGWKFLGIVLPRSWAPRGDSYESAKNGRFAFDIEIAHPWTGLIVKYSGTLAPVDSGAEEFCERLGDRQLLNR
jgi:hypothetical protein